MANQTDMEFLLKLGAEVSASYKAAMKAATGGLKSVSDAAKAASTASGKLRGSIATQEEKLRAVREEYIDAALASGKHSKQAKGLKKEYDKLNKELTKSKKRLDDAGKGLDNLGEGTSKAQKGVSALTVALGNIAAQGFGKLVDGIKSGISSFMGLSSSTREYRQTMSRLSATMKAAGYSTSYTQAKYDELYKYLGDSETVSNVMGQFASLNTEQATMDELLNGLIGTWAAYGGSVPVETLSEAIEETVKTGEVTGELQNALRLAGVDQKNFNRELRKCKTEEERAQLVADVLNATMGDQKAAYDESAASILSANDAQNQHEKTLAQLGETIEPVTSSISKGWNSVLQSFNDNIINGLDMDAFTGMIDDAFGWAANTAIPWIVEGLNGLPGFFATAWNDISTTVTEWKDKIESIWNDITGFFDGIGNTWTTAITGISTAFDTVKTSIETTWTNITGIFTGAVEWVKTTFSTDIGGAFGKVASTMSEKFGAVGDLIKVPINAVIHALNWIIDKVNNIAITLPDWGILGSLAGQTFGVHIDPIPELAKGGVATGPTLAMIGEGKENEAVLPLSRLDALLSASAPSVTYAPVINVTGGDATQVRQALSDGYQDFVRYMQQYQRQQRRVAFA